MIRLAAQLPLRYSRRQAGSQADLGRWNPSTSGLCAAVTSTPRPCGRGGVSVCPGAQALKTDAAPLVEASKLPDHRDGERALASEQPLSSAIQPDPGFVYILTNASMPGFVKIGLTRKDDVSERLRQLYTTGVALPFECVYSARVPDCAKLETVLHRVFGEKRVNPAREFFRADPDLAILIIDLVKIEELPVSDAEQGISVEQRKNCPRWPRILRTHLRRRLDRHDRDQPTNRVR
jgi:hypothetical protein